MSTLIGTDFDYTYNGKETTDIFINPSIMTPEVQSLFTVLPGVKSSQQLSLLSAPTKIVKAYSGCSETWTATGAKTSVTNRTLTTAEMEVRLDWCKDDFDNTILENLLASGTGANDATPQVKSLIQNIVLDGMRQDNFRMLSFGSTSGGVYYNPYNGLWPTLIAGESTYEVTKVDSISALNQTVGTRALDYFQALFEESPIYLKQMAVNEKAFYVTGNVYDNYLKTLETLNSSEGGWKATQDGILRPSYRGIPIYGFYEWDNWIEADTLGNNTRILYTTPKNHVVGTEKLTDSKGLSIWYEKKDRTVYVDAQFKMGYQYRHDALQAISYGNV
jgi:hypothetical protein